MITIETNTQDIEQSIGTIEQPKVSFDPAVTSIDCGQC